MPWRIDEDGSRTYVICADVLVALDHALGDVVDALMGELAKRHRIRGWECSADVPADVPVPARRLTGTDLEIELVDEHDDMALRRSMLNLAGSLPGLGHVELLDRNPLDLQRGS